MKTARVITQGDGQLVRLPADIHLDGDGRPRLTVTLPDRGALDSLAQTLARLLLAGSEGTKQT
jgi:hypothetical protein